MTEEQGGDSVIGPGIVPLVDAVNRSVVDHNFVDGVRSAGVTVIGRTILISSSEVIAPFGFEESLREIVKLFREVRSQREFLTIATSIHELEDAHRARQTALYVYFQSPEAIGNQMWRLELFRILGLRVLQLTYNQRSLAGDGCAERTDGGLSEFGLELVARCNEIGITVDVAHSGRQTTMEAIEHSSKPILLSHTVAKSLHDHPRAKSDEEMLACANRGGVVGVVGIASLLGTANPTIETFLDHLVYIVDLIGADHVGLGLDFTTGHERDDYSLLGYKPEMYQEEFNTGVSRHVDGLTSIGDIVNIRDGLEARGFALADIRKVMGENFIRVFRDTWTDEFSLSPGRSGAV